MEMRHSIAHLSIYGMDDVLAFIIKGDAPIVTCVSLYLRNQRCAYSNARLPFIKEVDTSWILT
jgi:hypothetical protein